MITRLRAPTSARPRLTISSSTCSSAISPPIATATSRVASSPRIAFSSLLATALAALVEARVVDRDRGPVGEDHRGLLVALGELAVLLLGQVQVAPRLPADAGRARRGSCASPDARPGTRSSTGCCPTSARRSGCGCSISAPSTPRPRGRSPIARLVSLVEPGGQELREFGALLVEDPERRVARAGDLPGGLQHRPENLAQIELAHELAPDIKESADPELVRDAVHLSGA